MRRVVDAASRTSSGGSISDSALRCAPHEVGEAPVVNQTATRRRVARRLVSIDLALDERRLWVEIPTGFTDMQQQAPELALEWRMHDARIFEHYFGRGYRAVDFELQRETRRRAISAG